MGDMLARLSVLRSRQWSARSASIPETTHRVPHEGPTLYEARRTNDGALPNAQAVASRAPTAVSSDRELLERALAAHAALDLHALTRQSWKCVGRADGAFAIHTQSSVSGRDKRTAVLCSGDVAASAEEVAAVLHAASEKAFEARMRAIHGKEFIFGSVERTVAVEWSQGSGPPPVVAIKTSSFAASDVLAKNEQWCFLEMLHKRQEDDIATTTTEATDVGGFTLSMSSVPPHESLRGRLPASRVRQLHNLTASYFANKLGADHRAGVRVHFYAAIDGSECRLGAAEAVVGRRGDARLQMLARGASKLPELIQRRRLGIQLPANQLAFDAKNARCTCCTRRFFALVVKKTRCYLCGFYVCEACSLRDNLEMCNGRLAMIIVCRRCLDGVNACNYSQLGASPVDDEHLQPRVIPDEPSPQSRSSLQQSLGIRYSVSLSGSSATLHSQESISTTDLDCESELKPSASSSSSSLATTVSCQSTGLSACSGSTKLLIDQLSAEMACDESSASRKAAAMTILGYLLDASVSETATAPADTSSHQIEHLMDSIHHTQATLVELANQALDVSSYPTDVDACKLANVRERGYEMLVARSASKRDATSYPVPENEAERLDAISRFGIDLLSNVDELNSLCALAAAEMNCLHGIVTLIERDTVRILAANSPENWDIGCQNVREQTFCQHFVMDARPLLVRHPEADVRFYNLDPVVVQSIRFYAGFPVRAADGTVVGALCCLDAHRREVTRSQYWRLTKLAEAASRVLQAKSVLAAAAAAALVSVKPGVAAESV